MKLAFSIDALTAAGDRSWRLLKDEMHWRPSTFAADFKSGDASLTDAKKVEYWHGRRLQRDRELGLKAKDKPGLFDFFMRGVFAHAIVHRFSPPAVPDKEQLSATLAAATPGRPWLLYLDLGGGFRVLDSSREKVIGNIKIAVRGEIASSPDYIWPKAAANAIYVDGIYRQFLAGWLLHLQSRRLGVFVPDVEKAAAVDASLAAIRNYRHE